MINQEVSKMFIQYITDKGEFINGTFDNVPENICGARVGTCFPIVDADGIFKITDTPMVTYGLYIGEVFNLSELLSKVNSSSNITSNGTIVAIKEVVKGTMSVVTVDALMKERMIEYSKSGLTNVVLTKAGVMPLNNCDRAFTVPEEMVARISEINKAYSSVSFSVEYSDGLKL